MNTVTFERRDFSGPQHTPGLSVEVERMSWRAVGGPWKARLRVKASDVTRLWQAAELVRCGVKVFDDLGAAWWGYVASVELHWKAASIQIGVEELANDVMVRYKTLSPDPWGGQDAFTSEAVDSTSIAKYGRREQVYALGPATQAQAEAFRAAQLARYASPFFSAGAAASAAPAGSYAILECRGWWATLDWLFYKDSRGAVGNTNAGSNLALKVNSAQVFGQSFAAGSEAWTVTEVWLRIGKEANPTDNFSVILANGLLAGDNIRGAVVAGASIPGEKGWMRFTISPGVLLTAGATYWLKIYRASTDAVNYFNISLDLSLGYSGGALLVYSGGNWIANVPDGDLAFMVRGTASQDTILSRMLTTCGQFFKGVRMESTIGFEGIPYRDGRQRGRDEIEAVLSQGLSTGKRLLARVEADRWLRVMQQPGGDVPELVIGSGGALGWRDGRRLNSSEQAAGRWARLGLEAGAIERAGAGGAPGTGAVFVEACAWDAQRGLHMEEE